MKSATLKKKEKSTSSGYLGRCELSHHIIVTRGNGFMPSKAIKPPHAFVDKKVLKKNEKQGMILISFSKDRRCRLSISTLFKHKLKINEHGCERNII